MEVHQSQDLSTSETIINYNIIVCVEENIIFFMMINIMLEDSVS